MGIAALHPSYGTAQRISRRGKAVNSVIGKACRDRLQFERRRKLTVLSSCCRRSSS